MDSEFGHKSSNVTGINGISTKVVNGFDPDDIGITEISFASEVNPSPCRPVTGGLYSVNSANP